MKSNQSRPRFELVSQCPFPTTITITPRAPPYAIHTWIHKRKNVSRNKNQLNYATVIKHSFLFTICRHKIKGIHVTSFTYFNVRCVSVESFVANNGPSIASRDCLFEGWRCTELRAIYILFNSKKDWINSLNNVVAGWPGTKQVSATTLSQHVSLGQKKK